MKHTIFRILVIVLIVKYSMLIAWSLQAAKWYADDIVTGIVNNYDASYDAICNAGEFVDHIAIAIGYDYIDAK